MKQFMNFVLISFLFSTSLIAQTTEKDTAKHYDEVLKEMQKRHEDIDGSYGATKQLKESVTPEMMTDLFIHSEKMNAAEKAMLNHAEQGNVDEAVSSAKEYVELLGIPSFYPLFKHIITSALDMNLTGPYGFDLDVTGIEELSSPEATKSLQKMIYLLTVLYPEMINTPIYYEAGKKIEMRSLRQEVLINLADGLFNKLKECSTEDDMGRVVYSLSVVKTVMTFSKSTDSIVLLSIDETFKQLGIK